jgi:hypothetical protein
MKRLLYIIAFKCFLLSGCEENEILSPDSQVTQVEININALKALGDSAWYEGWLVWGEEDIYHSLGVFRVDEQGSLSKTKFDVNLGYLQESKKFILTIEQDDIPGFIVNTTTTPETTVFDSVKGPSTYHILAATFMANSGELSIGHEDILDFNFISASGSYVLATPSDTLNLNPKSGVWFVAEDTLGNIIKGLNLPPVPSGWSYQGWVKIDGIVVSTGKFRNPGRADNDIQYYDTLSTGYNFPGEDFLLDAPVGLAFPLDLSTHNTEIYITLEPKRPANCNNPFDTIMPLYTALTGNTQPGVFYSLENNLSSLPFGRVNLNIELYE